MKNLALLLLVATTILTVVSSTAEARRWRHFRHSRSQAAKSRGSRTNADGVVVEAKKETACEAQRIVEMKNAVMAAHLLCKETITGDMYDQFIIRNRKRIKAANDVAVAWHMKKFGSRRKFDELDSHVMNSIASISSKNPPYFCERMEGFKPLVQTLSVDELLKRQTQLELPTCD